MRFTLTARRRTVLAAIHEHGAAAPSDICHTTGHDPTTVYATLAVFVRAGWLLRKSHPTRPAASVYCLTRRGQLGAGLQPKDNTA